PAEIVEVGGQNVFASVFHEAMQQPTSVERIYEVPMTGSMQAGLAIACAKHLSRLGEAHREPLSKERKGEIGEPVSENVRDAFMSGVTRHEPERWPSAVGLLKRFLFS